MWILLSAARAEPPLFAEPPRARREEPRCEVLLYHHLADEGDVAWVYRLELTAPDAEGRSAIRRVVSGGAWPEARPDTSAASSPAWVVDSDVLLVDGDRFVVVDQPAVDWTRWPLDLSFVGPRIDAPLRVARYRLSAAEQLSKKGPVPKEAWGGCMLELTGPGGGGCTIVRDVRGDCLARYAARHGLGAP